LDQVGKVPAIPGKAAAESNGVGGFPGLEGRFNGELPGAGHE
jgi:hypothetical protein